MRRNGVAPVAFRNVKPIVRIMASIIKYEYLPHRLVKAGLEVSEPLQEELGKKTANRLKLA